MIPIPVRLRLVATLFCVAALGGMATGVEKTTPEREAHVMKLLEDAISRNPKLYDEAMDELRRTATNRDVKTLERATRDKRIGIRCAALIVLTFVDPLGFSRKYRRDPSRPRKSTRWSNHSSPWPRRCRLSPESTVICVHLRSSVANFL